MPEGQQLTHQISSEIWYQFDATNHHMKEKRFVRNIDLRLQRQIKVSS